MKSLLKSLIIICILSFSNLNTFSQIQFTEPDSVVSYLNSDWDLILKSGGIAGNEWTPEQLGYNLRLEFGILPNTNGHIFYQSFKNDTLLNYKDVNFQYEQGLFGEQWYFDSLFLYSDEYYQYFPTESFITFYNNDSITIEEACFDCYKYIYERRECELFDTLQVYDTIVHNVYDTINIIIYDTIAVIDSVIIFDTITYNVFDTTYITIYDSILVYDTSFVIIYDTLLITDTILVYDTITIIIYDTLTSVFQTPSINIKVYPNPARDKILIQSPVYMEEIKIYTIRGELIKQEELNVFETILDLDINIRGTYLIKIRTPSGEIVKKLIIK